jgi:hypothetical protein
MWVLVWGNTQVVVFLSEVGLINEKKKNNQKTNGINK